MSHTLQRLVTMANQIGKAFAHLPHERAIAEVADHIRKFWEKRMLAHIYAHIDSGGAGLDELPKESLERLRETTAVS